MLSTESNIQTHTGVLPVAKGLMKSRLLKRRRENFFFFILFVYLTCYIHQHALSNEQYRRNSEVNASEFRIHNLSCTGRSLWIVNT